MKRNIYIIFIFFTIVIIIIYSMKFNISNNPQALTQSIRKYISCFRSDIQLNPCLVMSTIIDKQMIVVFNDQQNNCMGAAIFQKGLNGFLRVIKIEYSVGAAIQQISTSKFNNDNTVEYTALYSINCPPEIKQFVVKGNLFSDVTQEYVPCSLVSYNISESNFIELCRQSGEGELYLYDENGKEISKNYQEPSQTCKIIFQNLNQIDYICFLLFSIGCIISVIVLAKKSACLGEFNA